MVRIPTSTVTASAGGRRLRCRGPTARPRARGSYGGRCPEQGRQRWERWERRERWPGGRSSWEVPHLAPARAGPAVRPTAAATEVGAPWPVSTRAGPSVAGRRWPVPTASETRGVARRSRKRPAPGHVRRPTSVRRRSASSCCSVPRDSGAVTVRQPLASRGRTAAAMARSPEYRSPTRARPGTGSPRPPGRSGRCRVPQDVRATRRAVGDSAGPRSGRMRTVRTRAPRERPRRRR